MFEEDGAGDGGRGGGDFDGEAAVDFLSPEDAADDGKRGDEADGGAGGGAGAGVGGGAGGGPLRAAGDRSKRKGLRVGDPSRTTTKFMTKYERARILGVRALQLRYEARGGAVERHWLKGAQGGRVAWVERTPRERRRLVVASSSVVANLACAAPRSLAA